MILPTTPATPPQAFYRAHSPMSNPGAMADLYAALPDDLAGLCRVVQRIYLHYWGALGTGMVIPQERALEMDMRPIEAMLTRLQALDMRPLTARRGRTQRMIGCCRDAALLLVSFLRHKGVPARLRYGFAPYINVGAPVVVEHVVTEYWDGTRWRLADAEQTPALIAHNRIDFDVLDIPRDRFLVAGQVWQAMREGCIDPQGYGAVEADSLWRGEWPIRARLVNDINALNKVEYLMWDMWGLMDYHASLTPDQMALLDCAAALSIHAHDDSQFDAVRTVNQQVGFAQPEVFMCYSPVQSVFEVRVGEDEKC